MHGSSASPEREARDATMPFTVALTGGIASGKSAAADAFAALGAHLIDADVVARELVAPGSPALAEVVRAFGAGVLQPDGSLDRRRLRAIVFAHDGERRRLEAILHPRIAAEMRARATRAPALYHLLVIPLLVESGRYDWVDRVLVVDVPRELQLERLTARDGIDRAMAEAMLDAQASRAERLALADDVIDNAGSLADLERQVRALHARYAALAGRRRR